MQPVTPWQDSTWDRACRELFAKDEPRMLAWGHRYLAAYPAVHGEDFHLGARFREIVGARNRLQWWRTAVALLASRLGAAQDTAASQVSETAVDFGLRTARTDSRPLRDDRPSRLDATHRLRVFDLGTERQRRRERGVAAEATSPGAPAPRGYTREDLYE